MRSKKPNQKNFFGKKAGTQEYLIIGLVALVFGFAYVQHFVPALNNAHKVYQSGYDQLAVYKDYKNLFIPTTEKTNLGTTPGIEIDWLLEKEHKNLDRFVIYIYPAEQKIPEQLFAYNMSGDVCECEDCPITCEFKCTGEDEKRECKFKTTEFMEGTVPKLFYKGEYTVLIDCFDGKNRKGIARTTIYW